MTPLERLRELQTILLDARERLGDRRPGITVSRRVPWPGIVWVDDATPTIDLYETIQLRLRLTVERIADIGGEETKS